MDNHYTYRPGLPADVAACFKILPQGFVCEPELLAKLPGIWRSWLLDGSLLMGVIEDERRDIAAFGCSLFVDDRFIAEVQQRFDPPIAAQIGRLFLKGRSPVLSLRQVRMANSSQGLNLLVLMIGVPTWLDRDSAAHVRAKLVEAFYFLHTGYKLKSVMQEIYGDDEMRRGLAIGTEVFQSNIPKASEGSEHGVPIYFMGSTRDRVVEGSAVWPLFIYSPPKIFFSPGEQRVLQLALLDHTDHEIAESLRLSSGTIHKRWRDILARASDSSTAWLPAEASGQGGQASRGPEKRRYLLRYLRVHPEELRPIMLPARSSK